MEFSKNTHRQGMDNHQQKRFLKTAFEVDAEAFFPSATEQRRPHNVISRTGTDDHGVAEGRHVGQSPKSDIDNR